MRQGQTWLLVASMQPNPKGCLRPCLLWELFLLYLEFPGTSCMVFRVMSQDCDRRSHPCVGVSESWKYCVCYLEGKILSSPLQPGGIRLHFVCLKTFTPIPVFWGSGRKPQQQRGWCLRIYFAMALTFQDYITLEVSYLALPEEIVCLPLKLSVKTT